MTPCHSQSIDWLGKAEAGNLQAQYRLGKSFMVGDTIPKDIDQAITWLEKAALKQEPRAMYLLGLCYYKGEGKIQNDTTAYQYFKSSALQGYPQAQYSLALRYLKGEGVKKNEQRAFHWFRKASEAGVPQARYSVGLRLQKGEGVQMNKEMALRLYRELVLQTPHDPFFDYYLGYSYYYGTCGVKDTNAGSRYIQKAAVNGCNEAKQLLLNIRKNRNTTQQVTYF
ncbi:sel1 repeat family protein [Halosquirtibacter xylanolyticus]|uniref:tetratricopeptide repeat protein n=1 Tax=Halosquirtibacter xylanolyticus TaxID=3374599 RepID=UPI0037490993|nr:sel1 repeat family protein [Prolixibacteraceae bacterium]